MGRPKYTVEFYTDANGNEPAREWMRGLTPTKRRAIGVAIHEILGHMGIDVCGTEWGKQLGRGLFEFRLRHDADEVLSIVGRSSGRNATTGASERIVLRVYCHAYGKKVILLLGGHDKAVRSKKSEQDAEIALARKRLRDFLGRKKKKR